MQRLSPHTTAKRAAKRIRRHIPRSYKIVLFGSWATGTATNTSDVDIGIVGPTPLALERMHVIRKDLESLPTLRKIDVVDLQRTGKTFKRNVLKRAKQL